MTTLPLNCKRPPDAAGQMKTIARFQDLAGSSHVASSVFSYDGAGRLTDLVHQRIPVPGNPTSGQIIADYTWEWDAANRLTRHIDGKHADETADYTYDNRDQLTGADRTGTPNERKRCQEPFIDKSDGDR